MKKVCTYIAVIVLFGGFAFTERLHADDNEQVGRELLEQLRTHFNEGLILYADMRHEFYDAYTEESEVTDGEIWISDAMYRIKVTHQEVLVDGLLSRVYNEPQNKLLISEYIREEDDFAPSRFFSDSDDLFMISEVQTEDELIYITLLSEDPFEIFQKVRLVLTSEARPVSVYAIDQMDNEFHTRFIDAEFIPLSDDHFKPNFPESAEVVDLRN
ncbi:outer membrane lipoprotein carrier protein LolA [Balneolaceae bacterium ANBcel3]|nr:outer membrane lipoprotein carrier protein LolA [Balneolaceae bacterium ANBcel3]